MRAARSVLRIGPLSLVWRPRVAIFCGVAIVSVFVLAVLLLGTGTLALAPADVLGSLFGITDNSLADRVIWRIRLPRVLTAVFVGGALGLAGSIFQSISRNALGSPDVIGFTTGAATGAIMQMILFNAGPLYTALAAVLAGGATAATVLLLARKGGTTGGYRLVLVGVGIGAVLSGFNTALLVMGHVDQAGSAQIWLAGSLNTRTWYHVWPAALGFASLLPVCLWHARRIDLLEMGDDAASQLGVAVERTRFVAVMAAVGLTAIATAAAGPIAFVALAGPQLAKRMTASPDVPLLSGAAMGMALLLAADLISQRFPLDINMPIGLTTGLLGGFYLLWLLARSRNA